MAENEYLDSSKARQWQSVVQAVRVGASVEAVADRVVLDALQFVTGDTWNLVFTQDASPAIPPKYPLFRANSVFCSPPVVCLYSGGLDSAAGLARRLGDGIRKPLIPVVVRHRTDIATKVTDQIERLGRVFRTDLRPVCAAMSMASPQRIARSEESSQRGRGFLFVSVGGAVAAATDASVVELDESGVGAINVPLLAGMEGSQATRSAHPTFLRKMSRLLSTVADRPIDVTLPYSHLTKGELVCSLNRAELRELAQETVSCVSFPLRHQTRKSCGVCAACLFRRVALHTAGIDEAACMYQIDVLNQPSAAFSKLDYLKAFLNQIDSLSETDTGRLPLAVSKHLCQSGVIQQGSSVEGYIDLFRRYRREWLAFVAKAERNGCQWAKRIELPPKAA